MSTETETPRKKLKGEEMFFTCFWPFTYQGHRIEKDQILGPLPEDIFQDLAGRYQRFGRASGGSVKVQEMEDGFHKLSFTRTRYIESENWYKCKFVTDNNFVPAGFCCRLRMSDIRDFTNRIRYQDDPPLPAHLQVALIICQDRPKPLISAEKAAQIAADIEAGLAEQSRPSWMTPAMISPKLN